MITATPNAARGSVRIAGTVPNGPVVVSRPRPSDTAVPVVRGGSLTVIDGGLVVDDNEAPLGEDLTYRVAVTPNARQLQRNLVLTPNFWHGTQSWTAGTGRGVIVEQDNAQTPPRLVGSTNVRPASNTTSYTITPPTTGSTAIQAGDWAFLVHTELDSVNSPTVSGWERITPPMVAEGGALDAQVMVYRRKWAALDTSVTVVNGSSRLTRGTLLWIRGASDSAAARVGPVSVARGALDPAVNIAPGMYMPGSSFVFAVATERTTGNVPVPSVTNATYWTDISPTAGTTHTTIAIMTRPQPGTTPPVTFTYQGADTGAGRAIQIGVSSQALASSPMFGRFSTNPDGASQGSAGQTIGSVAVGALAASTAYLLTGRVRYATEQIRTWAQVQQVGPWSSVQQQGTWSQVQSDVDPATAPETSSPAIAKDTSHPGLYTIIAGQGLTTDTLHPGLYKVAEAANLVPDPGHPGLRMIGSQGYVYTRITAQLTDSSGATLTALAPVIALTLAQSSTWQTFAAWITTPGTALPAGTRVRLAHTLAAREYLIAWDFDQVGLTVAGEVGGRHRFYFDGDTVVDQDESAAALGGDSAWTSLSGDARMYFSGTVGNSVSVWDGPSQIAALLTTRIDAPVGAPCDPVLLSDPVNTSNVQWVGLLATGQVQRPARMSVFDIIGRADPIAISQVRGWERGTFTVLTETAEQRRGLLQVLGNGRVVHYRNPDPGYPERNYYLAIGDITEDRVLPDESEPARSWTLPWTRVARPDGQIELGTGTTWQGVYDGYPAGWQAVYDGRSNWLDVLDRAP